MTPAEIPRWRCAVTDPPDDYRDVLVWFGSFCDLGGYDERLGWIPHDAILGGVGITHWHELPEGPEGTQ